MSTSLLTAKKAQKLSEEGRYKRQETIIKETITAIKCATSAGKNEYKIHHYTLKQIYFKEDFVSYFRNLGYEVVYIPEKRSFLFGYINEYGEITIKW
jgi:predicted ATPase